MSKMLVGIVVLLLATVGANAATLYLETFDVTNGGYTHSGTKDDWQWGTPAKPAGPLSAHSSPYCWATSLTAHYRSNCDQTLFSPMAGLASYSGPFTVSCWVWYELDAGGDYVYWDYSTDGGGTWSTVVQTTGASQTWTQWVFTAPEGTGQLQLSWRLISNAINNQNGLLVDDVEITGEEAATATPAPPTATMTPIYTATPVPTIAPVVDLEMPAGSLGSASHPGYRVGDACSVDVTINNPNDFAFSDVPLFVVLDVFGEYFYGPQWAYGASYYPLDEIPAGTTTVPIIPDFSWPDCTGTADNLYFYAALINISDVTLFGNVAAIPFGFSADCSPTPTPFPTATMTPAGNGYISGSAVIHVTGARAMPSDECDKGTMFSIDGPDCQTAWVRIRNFEGESVTWQLKATNWIMNPDNCWGEWNYWQTQASADGDYVMTWGVDGNTWITCDAPNGTSETITMPYIMTFNHVVPYNDNCQRPSIAPCTSATVVGFSGDQYGSPTGCPY